MTLQLERTMSRIRGECAAYVEWHGIPIPPYRAYEVSSDGAVRRDGRELVGYVDRYGYRTVLLSYAGLSKRFKVHRLVCEAFHGPCPPGMECAHLDGNPLNNAASNLAWVTRSENQLQSMAHGTFAGTATLRRYASNRANRYGAANPCATLTQNIVDNIRARASSGETGRSISRALGINQSHVAKIIRGAAWPATIPIPRGRTDDQS